MVAIGTNLIGPKNLIGPTITLGPTNLIGPTIPLGPTNLIGLKKKYLIIIYAPELLILYNFASISYF